MGPKRLLDILLSVAGLILLSPMILLAAVLVRWQSPGPVFYRSPRIGLDGREFLLWKLRTMVVGADRGSALTGKGDPRITPIGRFLRKWKIDEFPQLVNVLAGEMSLVGPRPEAPSIVARYTAEQRRVLSVSPGITGPSQIRWRHEEETYPAGVDHEAYYLAEILPKKLRSDLEYAETKTLFKDFGYLWKTMVAIARK